ncbi:cupin domain-containing protein [Novosphingobium humi]|uniref:cupin domain-containing protein n=1 Tax=Novosphingobium humi TaxID=2282397 RepID=UPI0025B240D4|nr:cupin domain-containing protein [Novosphingobium humi]WJS97529.1 cupin domain-containing protein [Novosphingobium humi]
MQFAHFDVAAFLNANWQKRPLLIRNPWKAWVNPLEPDELAGLACEEGVESRLITSGSGKLALERGPFAEDRFAKLGKEPWTLLVQAVDHYVPDVAALIEPFRFVPDWRIDDVMVSYANDGGGVGPHFDQYDVFLIQGLGRRRWRVGPVCDAQTPLVPHEDLRLIEDFEATGDWVLEPGDILYVPPGFAHDGVAIGDDCMTYSVGFRAPSRAELAEGWTAHQVDAMAEDDRYSDPDLRPQSHPGEITAEALDRLHGMVLASLGDRDAFARWFGHYNSLSKYAETDWRPEEQMEAEEVAAMLGEGHALHRNPAHRFAFIEAGEGVLLFVDGVCRECRSEAAELARDLCAGGEWSGATPGEDALTLLTALINQGSLGFEEED